MAKGIRGRPWKERDHDFNAKDNVPKLRPKQIKKGGKGKSANASPAKRVWKDPVTGKSREITPEQDDERRRRSAQWRSTRYWERMGLMDENEELKEEVKKKTAEIKTLKETAEYEKNLRIELERKSMQSGQDNAA